MSKTNEVSLGSISCVLTAWHVTMAPKSPLASVGHIRRFSMTSPLVCSAWASTNSPFTNHRTVGAGRPEKIDKNNN